MKTGSSVSSEGMNWLVSVPEDDEEKFYFRRWIYHALSCIAPSNSRHADLEFGIKIGRQTWIISDASADLPEEGTYGVIIQSLKGEPVSLRACIMVPGANGHLHDGPMIALLDSQDHVSYVYPNAVVWNVQTLDMLMSQGCDLSDCDMNSPG